MLFDRNPRFTTLHYIPNAYSGGAAITAAGKSAVKTIADAITMQDVSSKAQGGCPSSLTTGQIYQLKDTRDNEVYNVARLADGDCWLLDNLRLGGSSAINLTKDDTNIVSNWTLPKSGTVCMSASSCTGTSGVTGNGYTVPGLNANWKNTISTTTHGSGSGKIGIYYNYCAASAGTVCTNSQTLDASYDICPKGWGMPSANSSGDYLTLLAAYSSVGTNVMNALSLPFSGLYRTGSGQYYEGNIGYWWSTTAVNNGATYYATAHINGSFSIGNFDIGPARYQGYAVRCLLK